MCVQTDGLEGQNNPFCLDPKWIQASWAGIMTKLKSPLTNTCSGSQTLDLQSESAEKSTIHVVVFMSKSVDRGTLYFLSSDAYFGHILTMSAWDLVCVLVCSGFPSKGARTSPGVANVCPAGPVVYASRGPGGQGRPWTHQFCRAEIDEFTVLTNHSIAIHAHMPPSEHL